MFSQIWMRKIPSRWRIKTSKKRGCNWFQVWDTPHAFGIIFETGLNIIWNSWCATSIKRCHRKQKRIHIILEFLSLVHILTFSWKFFRLYVELLLKSLNILKIEIMSIHYFEIVTFYMKSLLVCLVFGTLSYMMPSADFCIFFNKEISFNIWSFFVLEKLLFFNAASVAFAWSTPSICCIPWISKSMNILI